MRSRPKAVQGGEDSDRNEAIQLMAFETVSSVMSLGANLDELGELLRAYINDAPASVVPAIGARQYLVGARGGLQPLGVVAGLGFAGVIRASYSARFSWLQCLDWLRVSRMLCGLAPILPAYKSAGETVAGLENAVSPKEFDGQYGKAPVQPDDMSRLWGVNSAARLPAFGGEVC